MTRLEQPTSKLYDAQWQLDLDKSATIKERIEKNMLGYGQIVSPIKIQLTKVNNSREFELSAEFELTFMVTDWRTARREERTITKTQKLGRIFSLGNCGVVVWDNINASHELLKESSHEEFLNAVCCVFYDYFKKGIFMFTNNVSSESTSMVEILIKKFGEENVVYYETPFVNTNSLNHQIHGSICFK